MSLDDVREAVRYWRRIGSPINAEPDFVEVTLTQAEVLVELADAAREHVGETCSQEPVCGLHRALARLDGGEGR